MRTSTEGILAAAILAVIIGLFYLSPDAAAEEGSIIKIEAGGDKTPQAIAIRPQTLTVEKDTIVIWLNAVRDDELNILFDDGEQTKAATGNPSGFDLTKNGVYAAKYLPFIATASLRFVKPGTYSYRVISQKNKFETLGTITVP
jgi:hypothetical protein